MDAGALAGTGNDLANLITGKEAGNDTLDGVAGNDNLTGGDGFDTLSGGNGDDFLGGSKALDVMDGVAGNDTFQGGLGSNNLTGGLGVDSLVFSFADGLSVDTITDFTSGTDLIELSATVYAAFSGLVGQTVGLAALANNPTYYAGTGALAYDVDGLGAGAAANNFAILGSTTHPASLGNDFQIVA